MITVVSLQRTTFACPAQFEAITTDGDYVYIRYRHGNLSVRKSPTKLDGPETVVYSGNDGTQNGCLELDDLKKTLLGKVRFACHHKINQNGTCPDFKFFQRCYGPVFYRAASIERGLEVINFQKDEIIWGYFTTVDDKTYFTMGDGTTIFNINIGDYKFL